MKSLAVALGILLVTGLAANAAAPKKEAESQEKAKAPVAAVHKSTKVAAPSTSKKLHKKASITPAKAK